MTLVSPPSGIAMASAGPATNILPGQSNQFFLETLMGRDRVTPARRPGQAGLWAGGCALGHRATYRALCDTFSVTVVITVFFNTSTV
jgi:hypothetical protein